MTDHSAAAADEPATHDESAEAAGTVESSPASDGVQGQAEQGEATQSEATEGEAAEVSAGQGEVAQAETMQPETTQPETTQTTQSEAAQNTSVARGAIADPIALSRAEVAQLVDHTLLKTDASGEQVAELLAEAQQLGTYSICISPSNLPVADDHGDVEICTVVGFPSGKHHAGVKAVEASRAVVDGATEIDMVIDIGQLKADRADLVQQEIEAVRRAAPAPVVLKVIIESAALTDDEIVTACETAEAAGADFVKTSTGFHAEGGASVEAVKLMRETVGDRLGVKASGGIRSAETALAMLEAGANRLGLSGTAAVLDGWVSQ